MNRKRKAARRPRDRFRMRRHAFAVVFGVAAILTIVSVSGACPPPRVLGPPGYDPGNDVLVVAGTETPTLVSGDHVVICHAIGMAQPRRLPADCARCGGREVRSRRCRPPSGRGHHPAVHLFERELARRVARERSELDDRRAHRLRERVRDPWSVDRREECRRVGEASPGAFTLHVDAPGTAGDTSFAGSAVGCHRERSDRGRTA